jgi:hypothetical protein
VASRSAENGVTGGDICAATSRESKTPTAMTEATRSRNFKKVASYGCKSSGLSARTETADQFTMKVRNVDRDFNVDYDRLTDYTKGT